MVNDMRLIDADKLEKIVSEKFKEHYGNTVYQFIHDFFRFVIRQIRKATTIDAVPVVRCKDCKWFAECVGKDSGKPCGYGQCTRPLCMRGLIGTDDFCSYGERKDGAE